MLRVSKAGMLTSLSRWRQRAGGAYSRQAAVFIFLATVALRGCSYRFLHFPRALSPRIWTLTRAHQRCGVAASSRKSYRDKSENASTRQQRHGGLLAITYGLKAPKRRTGRTIARYQLALPALLLLEHRACAYPRQQHSGAWRRASRRLGIIHRHLPH